MALKPRAAKTTATDEQIEKLAENMADKPYGADVPAKPKKEKNVTRSILLPESLDAAITRAAAMNKFKGEGPTSISALAREVFEEYLAKHSPDAE